MYIYSVNVFYMHICANVVLPRRTGILVFGPPDCDYIVQTAESLQANSVPHKVFTGKDANMKYSLQLQIPDWYKCIYESDGGIIFANKALLAFQVTI